MAKADTGKKQIARNRKAFHNFEVLETHLNMSHQEVQALTDQGVLYESGAARRRRAASSKL